MRADLTKQTIINSTIFCPQNHQAISSILPQTVCSGDNKTTLLNDFSKVEKRLEDKLLTRETSEWGYIVEVNLTIHEELHDFIDDYLLAASREVLDIVAMSN